MILYPAIDLKDGKCVRLRQGRMEDVTVYGERPAQIAREFEDAGAIWVHVVDLNGAFEGRSVNDSAIHSIRDAVGIRIQAGGGIRSMRDVDRMFEVVGVDRVILGSAAVEDPGFVEQAVKVYGGRIAVGIDARGGMAAVHGWGNVTGIEAAELARHMKNIGVRTIIYTDIARDGMMSGPNFETAKRLMDETDLDIILSGGVSSMDDVQKAKELGMSGTIIGKALYTGAIDLREALQAGGE